jgi:hypothetical protein
VANGPHELRRPVRNATPHSGFEQNFIDGISLRSESLRDKHRCPPRAGQSADCVEADMLNKK